MTSSIDENLPRSRPGRRALIPALLVLVVLLAAACIVAASVAVTQRDRADREATIAESGQLAALAQSLTGSNIGLAELFAAEAYKLHADPQTRAALFDAVTADPHLVRYLQATGTVSALAASGDAGAAVAGTADGEVLRWSLTDFSRTVVARLPAAISGVAVSADGGTIAAVDGTAAEVWRQGQGARSIPVPGKLAVTAVAVSPSGRYVALSVHGNGDPPYDVMLFDTATGRSVMARLQPQIVEATNLSFSSQTQLVVVLLYGAWERLAIPSLTRLTSGAGPYGATTYAVALSPTGTYFSSANGGSPVPIWNTTLSLPRKSQPQPPLGAEEVGAVPDALAISAGGQRAADAYEGAIYVSDVTAYKNAVSGTPLTLAGSESINPGALTFVGQGDSELLSASANLVTLWNLDQYSRIATEASIDIPTTCEGCSGPDINISPDSNRAVMTIDGVPAMTLAALPPVTGDEQLLSGQQAGQAAWSADGQGFSVLTPANGSGGIWSAPGGGRASFRSWIIEPAPSETYDSDQDPPEIMTLTADGKRLVEIDGAGNVVVRDALTGAVERTVTGPISPLYADVESPYQAAVDPQGRYAAIIVAIKDKTFVTDIQTGAKFSVPGGAAYGVAYDGEQLLIQRDDGTLEVRSADGRQLIRSFAGDPDVGAGPVVSGAGLAVEANPDGTAQVFDVASGQEIGSITLPVGPRPASTTVAFTPSGNLVSATEGVYGSPSDVGQLTEWDFSASLWTQVACASAGRSLSDSDWREYVGPSGPAMPGNVACSS